MSKQDDPRQPSRQIYADIIDLPHHEPDPIKHPRMSLYNRAAQFAPFAALSGYDEMVAEEARVTDVDHMRSLEPDEAEELNQKIQRLIELTKAGEHQTVAKHPTATIIYYEPDQHKPGGRHVTITDKVRRVDTVKKVIELESMDGVLNRGIEIV